MCLSWVNFFYQTPTPKDIFYYLTTESVEPFVYPVVGIWRSPDTNKQNPTPNRHTKRYAIDGDWLLLTLVSIKSPNFNTKD